MILAHFLRLIFVISTTPNNAKTFLENRTDSLALVDHLISLHANLYKPLLATDCLTDDLKDIKQKVYTRDLFSRD